MSGITIAVLVGIEEYADAAVAPTLKAPCLDAVRMALRMPKLGAEPEHTFLFLQPRAREGTQQTEYQTSLQSLDPRIKARTCDQQILSTFWRDELQKLQAANPGSRLFFYWSGHGFSDANAGVPLLLCHDYTSNLTDRVVNRDELLAKFHSSDYENLGSQLLLFDACANNVPIGSVAGTSYAQWSNAVDQVSIAAALRGTYAHGDETGGEFTRVALEAMDACDTWPEPLAFWNDLKTRLESASMPSAAVSVRRQRHDVPDDVVYVGTVTKARAELAKSLGDLPIKTSDYLIVYRWVTDALSPEPNRGKATDIRGMLRDLWDARGAASAEAPYPIVEFVARLLNHFPEAAPLQDWLDNPEYVRKSDVVEATANLTAESKMLVLEVEIVEGTNTRPGAIVGFSTRLFRFDRVTNVSPPAWVNPQAVTSDDDFKTLLTERLKEAHTIATDYQTSLTVEFLTNLFNIVPHQFDSVAGGGLLPAKFGSDHPVLLRWRGRHQQSVERRITWIDRTQKIRAGKVAVPLHPLSDHKSAVPDCRVVFVSYALKSDTGPGPGRPATSGWQALFHSIQSGVPFVCWICDGSDDVPGGEKEVADWFDNARQLAQIPAHICSQRAPDALASAINVFWDDPLTTYQLREIRVGQKK